MYVDIETKRQQQMQDLAKDSIPVLARRRGVEVAKAAFGGGDQKHGGPFDDKIKNMRKMMIIINVGG